MESQRDFVTDGLVVREYELGEHDKMLTLLTPAYGRIPVIAKGARSLRNKYMTPARLFTYANYELHRRGDMTWLRSAEIIEPFPQLEREITRLYLAQYLADLACELSGEGEPAVDILRLTLNSLYAVCRGVKDQRLIKGTFEWRAAGYSGYLPESTEGSVLVPDVTGMSVNEAKHELSKVGLEATFQDDENELVTAQVPSAGGNGAGGQRSAAVHGDDVGRRAGHYRRRGRNGNGSGRFG